MNYLEKLKTRIEELRDQAASVVSAQRRVTIRQNEMKLEILAVDAVLDKLALADAQGDMSALGKFTERYFHRQECFALQDMSERALKLLAPLLNDKSRSHEIKQLQFKVELAEYREEFLSILERLNKKYDEDLEQNLIRLASLACLSIEDINEAAYTYHCKHGIPTNRYDPLRLEPPRPGMQI